MTNFDSQLDYLVQISIIFTDLNYEIYNHNFNMFFCKIYAYCYIFQKMKS